MTRYFRRRRPGRDDDRRAAAIALGVGVATGVVAFYLGRLFLTREVLGQDGSGRSAAPEGTAGSRRTTGGSSQGRSISSRSSRGRPPPKQGGSVGP